VTHTKLYGTVVGSVARGERNVSILSLRLIVKVLRVPLAELRDGLAWPYCRLHFLGQRLQ
jgi:hypothetical protein